MYLLLKLRAFNEGFTDLRCFAIFWDDILRNKMYSKKIGFNNPFF